MTKINFSKTELKIFFISFVLYTVFIHWVGSNEESTFALLRAIAEKTKINIDNFYNNTVDRQFYDKHYYATKPPGLPIIGIIPFTTSKLFYTTFFTKLNLNYYFFLNYLSVPVNKTFLIASPPDNPFILFSKFCVTVLTSSLFSALTVVLVYKILKYFTKNKFFRILATFTYALGTFNFVYSVTFYVNATSIFLIFSSFVLLFENKIKREYSKGKNFVSGIFAGFALITDYTIFSIFFPLIIYSFFTTKNKKILSYFLIGLFLGISPLLVYNYYIFGNIFDSILRYPDPQIWSSSPSITESTNLGLHLGFNPYIILHLLVYPDFGLFFYYPVLLFSILGLLLGKKHKAEFLFISSALVLIIFLDSIFWGWWGGASFGPRYLVTIMPFLILPMTYKLNIKTLNIFLILLTISIFVNLLSLSHWETNAQDPNTLDLKTEIKNQTNSFKILYNPFEEYYFRTFLKNGVQSHVINNILLGNFIDIKDTDQNIKFISNNGTLIIYHSHETFVNLEFDAESINNKTKILTIHLINNTNVSLNITTNYFKKYNVTSIEINSGRTEIEFVNTGNCNLKNETLVLNDIRCLSIGLKNIRIQEIQK